MKNSVVLSYLDNAAFKLSNEVHAKNDGDEFLPEISEPHLHKRKTELHSSYHMLIVEIHSIRRHYGLHRPSAKVRFKAWLEKLRALKVKENHLHFDACLIDLGGDH